MSRRMVLLAVLAGIFLAAGAAQAGTVSLGDWCFNFNGDFNAPANYPFGYSCNGGNAAAPVGFDATLEPGTNILGTASFNMTAGQFVIFYSNYDVNYDNFGSFDDTATTLGSLPTGWSYMLADPNDCNSCVFTDMYDAFADNALTNTNTVGTAALNCCDVSASLAVVANSTTTATFTISTTDPGSGFRIQQTNQNTGDSIYISAAFDIPGGGGGGAVPEPSTLALGASGAVAIWLARKRAARKA